MELQLTPELQMKLEQVASATGRPQTDVLLDAVAGYFDGLDEMRTLLERRYHDVASGAVHLLDGEEVFARLRAKSEARRKLRV